MSGIDLDYADFECRKIKKRVIITSIILPETPARADESPLRAIAPFDCNHKTACGVLVEQGEQKIFNWHLCVHPELRAQQTGKTG